MGIDALYVENTGIRYRAAVMSVTTLILPSTECNCVVYQ
jgi:hypothetical protein